MVCVVGVLCGGVGCVGCDLEIYFWYVFGDDQFVGGFCYDFFDVDFGGVFVEDEGVVFDFQVGQVGEYFVNVVVIGQWQGVVWQQFGFVVFGGVGYGDDDVFGVGYQVYGVVYVFDQFVGDYLGGDVVVYVYFEGIEYGEVDVVVMDYGEGLC